jgi:hypothetical protein
MKRQKQFCLFFLGLLSTLKKARQLPTRQAQNAQQEQWAPPSENNTQAYIANVVKYSGVAADDVLTATSGDTVFLEKYRYSYRDKIIQDSILKTDTIRVLYPVEVIKEVKKPLTG